MKKTVIALCVAILTFTMLAGSTVSAFAAAKNKAYNWYCKHRNDGKQPECDGEMRFINDCNGFYIDTKHTSMDDGEKVIYLTFDAGYENGNIERILDVLKAENVPAAFFVLENLVKKNGDLIKRMADEGHTVCNHTATHKDMTKVSDPSAFAAELKRLDEVCLEYTGVSVAKYYRPPEGRFTQNNLEMASKLGYKTVLWSFAYADWDNNNQMSREKAMEKIINGTHNGEVILLHPTSKTNADILSELICKWREMGFRFSTLDELTAI